MIGFLTTTRFQIRGLAALAVAALMLLGSAPDADASQKGTAAKVITSAVIACEALGGTATVDSVLDGMSVNNQTPVLNMSCSGGKLDGWGCDGLGDYVKCGTMKLTAPGSSGRLPTFELRPASLPVAEVIVVAETPAVVVEETAPELVVVEEPAVVVEETGDSHERGETAVVDTSINVDAEPVADATVVDAEPVADATVVDVEPVGDANVADAELVVVVATDPASRTSDAVVVTGADEER